MAESPEVETDDADDTTGTCESCGRDREALTRVRRVYVTPEAWDAEGKVEVVDEPEAWCFVCLTHYPHQPVAPQPPEGDRG